MWVEYLANDLEKLLCICIRTRSFIHSIFIACLTMNQWSFQVLKIQQRSKQNILSHGTQNLLGGRSKMKTNIYIVAVHIYIKVHHRSYEQEKKKKKKKTGIRIERAKVKMCNFIKDGQGRPLQYLQELFQQHYLKSP